MACSKILKNRDIKGHFTWRFLKNMDQKYHEELQDCLKREFENEPHARRHAIMNLLGFVHCCLHDTSKGIKLFQQVMHEDETNLNAVCNLVHAYDGISMQKEKEKHEQLFKSIVAKPDIEVNIFLARALIEEAIAACFTDQHKKQADFEFAKKMFDEGMELGNKYSIKTDELLHWKFGLAFHLNRLDNRVRLHGDITDNKYCRESIKQFYEVTLFSQEFGNMTQMGVTELCGKAWAFLGVTLNLHKNEFANLNSVFVGCRKEHAEFDGNRCLDKALDIAPKCACVLRHVCHKFHELKQYQMALNYGLRAIQVQKAGYAYYLVGKVYLSMHQDGTDLNSKDNDWLDLAIWYFEKTISRHFKLSYVICNLATAYLLKEDKVAALDKYKMAAEVTGGSGDYHLYLQWAQCLDEIGDHRGANSKREHAQKIKSHAVPTKYDFVAFYSSKDTDVPEIIESIEQRLRIKGYMFVRDCVPGTKIPDETENLTHNNSCFLLFVSKNSVASIPFQNEVTFITKESQGNSQIIPILLDLEVEHLPYAFINLASMHAIKYNSRYYWDKLSAVFKASSV